MSKLVLFNRPERANGLSLFDREFTNFLDGFWNFEHTSAFNPSAEVIEREKDYKLVLETPGLSKDDVHVEIKKGVLRLWGEKKTEERKKDETCSFSERRYGSFERTFQLPENVETGKIDAQYRDGVLELTIPKAKEEAPKTIEVKIK